MKPWELSPALGNLARLPAIRSLIGPRPTDLDLRPDLAFISCERWAQCRHVPTNHVWHVVPDLVVEIIRSSEQTEKLSDSLEAYFRSGVNRVWIIYPEQLKIHDHDSLSSSGSLAATTRSTAGPSCLDFSLL